MPELRINDAPAAAGRRVEVTWQDGPARRKAVAELGVTGTDPKDAELMRWYLEEYAEFPADPAPTIARDAEARLAEVGGSLFTQVFAGLDAAVIWGLARDRLGEVRVEVDADPGEGAGLAWELLRDPGTDSPVALAVREFVRTHLQAAAHPSLPEPSGDRLRVLLVIARPGGRDDVPFRSVASRLVRGGAEQMDGLDLDVLRPATFKRLSGVLHAAKDAGRPYHVVHFDGHGDWLDLAGLGAGPAGDDQLTSAVSIAGPIRPGSHGYLLFEDFVENQQLVDGPTLGRLLVSAGVPVLVLNACRSGYTEASERPRTGADEPSPPGPGGDVHARIRAYGSLAAEVADTGVPGVVAMRYNVYVVTAAQFVADLYAHLLAGKPLGQATAAARRALSADPNREIGPVSVSLQDWAVPLVYEAAPLVLLRPARRAAPLVKLTPTDSAARRTPTAPGELPRPPDAGFFGRDETLLALDRAFDTQQVVLLQAFAGAGKSATAAEFARWYQVTGGLDDPGRPDWSGAALWSSFEHHLTADRLIGQAGDHFAAVLEANGIAWAAVTDPAARRDLVMQILAQLPVLWLWDNVEPVAGFPEGTPSDWAAAEQAELADLLRDLAQRTRCKVLLTSRRNERSWLAGLPARVRLPGMPLREAAQLAGALAARHGASLAGADWRPLLRYAVGNPLTITVLVGQALREHLTTTEQIAAFVNRLRASEMDLEPGEDAALGRTRSLAASLSYGFAQAFTNVERAQLAVLHLFRDATNVDVLRLMGDVDDQDAVPELAGLTRSAGAALLDRAADIGLLEWRGGRYYQIHPALPWYFTSLFLAAYGQPDDLAARRAVRAYTRAIGTLGDFYHDSSVGREAELLPALKEEEANFRHALDLARAAEMWDAAVGCLQGLRILYERTGRPGEWARLVADVAPDVTDNATGEPLPGREEHWSMVTSYRVRLAIEARNWPVATSLQKAVTAWDRGRAATALSAPGANLTPDQRKCIHNLSASLCDLGDILFQQGDPGCLPLFHEALALDQRIGDRTSQAKSAFFIGDAYLHLPGQHDLEQAEHWIQSSFSLRDEGDSLGQSRCLRALGTIALMRFDEAHAASHARPMLLGYLNAATQATQQALELTPADDHQQRAITENQLGIAYLRAVDNTQALRHFQQAIWHHEARRDAHGAGVNRLNIASLLANDGRTSDALLYARAALANFRQVGPGATSDIADAERLIADLELRAR